MPLLNNNTTTLNQKFFFKEQGLLQWRIGSILTIELIYADIEDTDLQILVHTLLKPNKRLSLGSI